MVKKISGKPLVLITCIFMIYSCRIFESTNSLNSHLHHSGDHHDVGDGLLQHLFDDKIRVCFVATHLPVSNLEEHRMLFEKSYDLWLMKIRTGTQKRLATFDYLTADSGCKPHIIDDIYSPENRAYAEVTVTVTDSPVVVSSVVLEEGGRVSFFVPARSPASLPVYIHSMGHAFNIDDDEYSEAMGQAHTGHQAAAHQPRFLSGRDYEKITEKVCGKYRDFMKTGFCR